MEVSTIINVVTVKKAVVKTTVPNTNSDAPTTQSTKATPATTATPVKAAGRPRTNTVATYQKPLFLSIRDVQKILPSYDVSETHQKNC